MPKDFATMNLSLLPMTTPCLSNKPDISSSAMNPTFGLKFSFMTMSIIAHLLTRSVFQHIQVTMTHNVSRLSPQPFPCTDPDDVSVTFQFQSNSSIYLRKVAV